MIPTYFHSQVSFFDLRVWVRVFFFLTTSKTTSKSSAHRLHTSHGELRIEWVKWSRDKALAISNFRFIRCWVTFANDHNSLRSSGCLSVCRPCTAKTATFGRRISCTYSKVSSFAGGNVKYIRNYRDACVQSEEIFRARCWKRLLF